MNLALWQHVPTQGRFIVLVVDGVVQQAAGPLDAAQMAAIQRDEWAVPWMPGVAEWVERHHGEFAELHPRMGETR